MITGENIGGAVLLRKLTHKSVLWFGKHEGLRVQQLIDLQHQTYLRWVYYNCNGISFVEEILEKLKIAEDKRISKPGTCPEFHNEICQENQKKMGFKAKSHMRKVTRVRKAAKEMRSNRNSVQSKSVMQAYNLKRI